VSPSDHRALYDTIGTRYAQARVPDPRIEAQLHAALGDASSVLNVGAGAGSYEPRDRVVVALEPSEVMVRQRPDGSAPCVRGVAGALPYPDGAFDAAMASLSLHHWPDWRAGVDEMGRVASRVVIFTFEPQMTDALWLVRDYLPEMDQHDAFRFPPPEEIVARFSGGHVETVPVPWDCTDGFTGAYWRRPEAYLDPRVQGGTSAIAVMDPDLVAARLAQLRADLESGAWDERHGALRDLEELDLGYRLVVCDR
jgi:SAM-dependent methyltransferase